MNCKGVSLLEILLSAIIFLIAVTGVFYTMVAIRTPVTANTKSLEAVRAGQQFLESLRSSVDGATYDTGLLSVTTPTTPHTSTQGIYTFSYTVTDMPCTDGSSCGRKVDLTVTYPD